MVDLLQLVYVYVDEERGVNTYIKSGSRWRGYGFSHFCLQRREPATAVSTKVATSHEYLSEP